MPHSSQISVVVNGRLAWVRTLSGEQCLQRKKRHFQVPVIIHWSGPICFWRDFFFLILVKITEQFLAPFLAAAANFGHSSPPPPHSHNGKLVTCQLQSSGQAFKSQLLVERTEGSPCQCCKVLWFIERSGNKSWSAYWLDTQMEPGTALMGQFSNTTHFARAVDRQTSPT